MPTTDARASAHSCSNGHTVTGYTPAHQNKHIHDRLKKYRQMGENARCMYMIGCFCMYVHRFSRMLTKLSYKKCYAVSTNVSCKQKQS